MIVKGSIILYNYASASNAMNVAADVSIIMAVLLNEPERAAIELAAMGNDLIAPGCVSWEVGNALYGAIRRSQIKVSDALSIYAEFKKIPLRQISVDVAAAIGISAKHKIPAYDAYYLECARAQQAPILTLDARMLKVAEAMNIKIGGIPV
jgi:predicted nucleic acid-binding protein